MMARTSRRVFLGDAIRAGAGLCILESSASATTYGANERLGVALVGVGGRGSWFVGAIPDAGENVVALCDVNDQKAAGAYRRFPDLPRYRDVRKMLDRMRSEIDAIVVATPDNTHAVCAMAGIERGKHVYCEKPLSHDVAEARALRAAAARRGVATQLGNQGTASEGYRRAVGLVRAGVIGEVREVHVWNTNGGPGPRPAPGGSKEVPGHLDWDLWLGPARARPYHPAWMSWHGWRDFGTGQLGNWACHTANLPFRALDLPALWDSAGDPPAGRTIRVTSEVAVESMETFPRHEIVHYQIPARGTLPPVEIHWYNGAGRAPEVRALAERLIERRLDWGDAGERRWQDHAGCVLVGTKGALHSTGHNTTFSLHPAAEFPEAPEPKRFLPRSPGHEREWIRAAKGGPPALSSFDYGGRLTEFVLLGNIATRHEGTLEYDPVAGRIVNHDAANAALRRDYREGWSL